VNANITAQKKDWIDKLERKTDGTIAVRQDVMVGFKGNGISFSTWVTTAPLSL